MDFRLKCAMQQAFSLIPGGRHLNYVMQRYVTKTIPCNDSEIARREKDAARHIANYGRGVPGRVLEFGGGYDLCMAHVMARAGCRVTTIDIERNAKASVVAETCRKLRLTDEERARVTYLAPIDLLDPRLEPGSFDLVMSTSVLEHIPEREIKLLLWGCRRLLAPNGVCSFLIDYNDHWAYSDHSIARNNFLRYSDVQWALLNPPAQFQNRLRHSDYVKRFLATGFSIAEQELFADFGAPTPPLAPRFSRYSKSDLEISGAWFVLHH